MVLIFFVHAVYTMFWFCRSMYFYGFVDGAFHRNLNLASAAWVFYSPAHDLVSSWVVCIGPYTNNIVKYQVVIGLLTEAASWDIHDLVVFKDSQLVVCHLNHVYTIKNHTLLHLFQRVHLLESSFDFITYRYIPRSDNMIIDSLENFILYWHIAHS